MARFSDGLENNSADEHETKYPGDGVDTPLDMLAQQEALGARTPLHRVGLRPKVDPETPGGLAESTQGYCVGTAADAGKTKGKSGK